MDKAHNTFIIQMTVTFFFIPGNFMTPFSPHSLTLYTINILSPRIPWRNVSDSLIIQPVAKMQFSRTNQATWYWTYTVINTTSTSQRHAAKWEAISSCPVKPTSPITMGKYWISTKLSRQSCHYQLNRARRNIQKSKYLVPICNTLG